MNNLSLHLRDDRASIFDAGAARPIVFDSDCRRWIVTDGRQILELLREPRLISPSIVPGLVQLEKRHGRRLPNLIFAANHIPLLNEGAAHVESRRRMSRYLSATRERLAALSEAHVDRHFACLESQMEVELIADVLQPLMTTVFSNLLQAKGEIPFQPLSLTKVFDAWVGLNGLLAAEARIGETRRLIRERIDPAMSQEDEGLLLALTILGRDSLLATIAESIRAVVTQNRGLRLDEIAYPEQLPETGVAIAERQVSESFEYGGAQFREGDWVRLYYHGVMHGPARNNPALMFSTGAHACLGRHLSLDLWHAIARRLSAVPRRAELAALEYGDSRVFVMPRFVRLRLE